MEKVTTKIDPDLCVGCGLCVQVCPVKTLSMVNGKAEVTGDLSLNCGHCQAICPEGAVTVGAIDETMSEFVTFQGDSNWLAYGEFNTGQLVRLMASGRPCPDPIALIHLRFINFLNTSALICDMTMLE